jgi:hypothetical protein
VCRLGWVEQDGRWKVEVRSTEEYKDDSLVSSFGCL